MLVVMNNQSYHDVMSVDFPFLIGDLFQLSLQAEVSSVERRGGERGGRGGRERETKREEREDNIPSAYILSSQC